MSSSCDLPFIINIQIHIAVNAPMNLRVRKYSRQVRGACSPEKKL